MAGRRCCRAGQSPAFQTTSELVSGAGRSGQERSRASASGGSVFLLQPGQSGDQSLRASVWRRWPSQYTQRANVYCHGVALPTRTRHQSLERLAKAGRSPIEVWQSSRRSRTNQSQGKLINRLEVFSIVLAGPISKRGFEQLEGPIDMVGAGAGYMTKVLIGLPEALFNRKRPRCGHRLRQPVCRKILPETAQNTTLVGCISASISAWLMFGSVAAPRSPLRSPSRRPSVPGGGPWNLNRRSGPT